MNFFSKIYRSELVGMVDAIYNTKNAYDGEVYEDKFIYWLKTSVYFNKWVKRSFTVVGDVSRREAKEHRRYASVVYPWIKTGILHLAFHWPPPTTLELDAYVITHSENNYLIGTPTP